MSVTRKESFVTFIISVLIAAWFLDKTGREVADAILFGAVALWLNWLGNWSPRT